MLGNLRSCCGCCVYWTASNLRINSFSSRPSLVRLYGNSTVNGCFEGTKEEQKQKQKGEAAPKDGAKAASTKPITVPILRQMKAQGTPVAALTAYDYMMAAQLEPAGIEVVLVGDSLGNVMQGHATTLPVKLEDMIYHTQLVSRALKKALLISDMPFSCMQSVETVVSAAVRLLTEAGAAMVKLEMSPEGGGQLHLSMVRALAERQVPVCVHLGLTPQSVHALGGFRVQGTEKASRSAQLLIDQAVAAEQAGASMLLLECVPTGLAKQITERVGVPTIGIGAGVHCDIQLLILHDMLGLSSGHKPAKFVKNFLRGRDSIREAFAAYVSEVRTREFPAEEHSYH